MITKLVSGSETTNTQFLLTAVEALRGLSAAEQLYPSLLDAPTQAAFIAMIEDILNRIEALESGPGGGPNNSSLDFSNADNSQYVPVLGL